MKDINVRNFMITFFVSLLVCAVVTVAYIRNKSLAERATMDQVVTTRATKVTNVLTKLLYKAHILSALVIQHNGSVEGFNDIAAKVIDEPSIKNVILAPDGKVSAVYPYKGNEDVLGLDYFSEGAGNYEAILARDSGQLVLGGPFTLVQGGEALVGRLPVYVNGGGDSDDDKRFWGLVSVTLNYPQALDGAELNLLKDLGLAFEIWRISPETGERQVIANSNYEYSHNAPYVEQPLNILNAKWFFRLSPIRTWYEYPETWIFFVVGMLISWLIARLVQHNGELKNIRLELEALSYRDFLTGLLNRRGLMKRFSELLRTPNAKFVLCYIDLNKFKSTNDSHGHNAGDRVLVRFAEIINTYYNKRNNIVARVGGDEFVIIFRDCSDKAVAERFLEPVRRDCEQAVTLNNGVKIDVSFSMGTAVYPTDGTSTNELLGFADRDMYRMKTSSSA